MKIIPLSEGSFTVDKSKQFIPFDKTKDDLQQRPLGSLLVEVQPFVVITKNDVILLDTGLGFSFNGQMQVHQNLAAQGIQPGDVTKVLMSHLHKDHAGGIAMDTGSGRQLSFSNARYYIHQQELSFALDKNNRSYIQEDFDILPGSPQLNLINDEGTIDGIIRYQMTGAHCPYHTVFHIEEDNEHVFFGGDVAPQLQQMKNKFIAKYDFDGKRSMELRQQWWKEGHEGHWTFLFYHDIKTPSIRL